MFTDRTDAGHRLADRLEAEGITPALVLAIPRGGLPIARPVADRLDVPLDVVVARKIGAPWNPELAVGAVTSDGTTWLNDAIVDDHSIDDTYLEEGIEAERRGAAEKLEHYRGEPGPPAVEGQDIIIVDDGVATGATMFACVEQLRGLGAKRITVAVPVGAPDAIARLRSLADAVVCLEEPRYFGAVGRYYTTFEQVSHEDAIALLEGDG